MLISQHDTKQTNKQTRFIISDIMHIKIYCAGTTLYTQKFTEYFNFEILALYKF